jgi:hypothetical protein
MEIRACPKCGSKRIDAGTMGAGVTYGVTSWKSMCRDCGYQGEPILFDTEDAYNKFLEGIKNSTAEEKQESDGTGLPTEEDEEDPEVKELLEDIEEGTPVSDEETTEKKDWLIEIILAMIISAIWVIFFGSSLIMSYDFGGAIIYGILFFVVSAVFILFIIVIIEYFVKKITKMFIK